MFSKSLAASAVAVLGPLGVARAQEPSADEPALTELSLEELLNVEVTVTSASRHEQSLTKTPAAIFVLTAEDIQRSGATALPEVLRLVPGVEVARLDSNRWAVSIRGFNDQFANKILVLVDGRSVYTPLFSGTLWDTLDLPLEEIERIEVIRGPGAALWGANAVNGIVNVITKSAADTQGSFASATAGDQDRFLGYARHGGASGDGHWRVWARWADRAPTGDPAGGDGVDEWSLARFGFRTDFAAGERDRWTVEGGGYATDVENRLSVAAPPPQYLFTGTDHVDAWGASVQSRWTRALGERDELSLQGYVDLADRRQSIFEERRTTAGLDFQRRQPLGERHDLTWGAALRVSHSATEDTFVISWRDADRTDLLLGGFVQDEVALVPGRWSLTAGAKVEHEDQTGVNLQPNLRLLFAPSDHEAWWCALSHAVRTPSQAEQDLEFVSAIVPGMPDQVVTIFGDRDVDSERMDSVELGYRSRPTERVSLDVALFANHYRDLIVYEPGTPYLSGAVVIVPVIATNVPEADAFGVEVATDWAPRDDTRVSLAWTLAEVDVDPRGTTSQGPEDPEGTLPEEHWRLRIQHDFDAKLRGDLIVWRVDELATGSIDGYWRLDANVQYRADATRTFAVGVQNVLHDGELEFGPGVFNPSNEMRTALYVRATWGF